MLKGMTTGRTLSVLTVGLVLLLVVLAFTLDGTSRADDLDGSLIAFGSNRDSNDEVYVLDPTDLVVTNLTNNSAVDDAPDWNTDGSRIAFRSNRDGNQEIYRMDYPNTTNVVRLTDNSFNDNDPTWCKNGTIVFVSVRGGSNNLYIMNGNDGL